MPRLPKIKWAAGRLDQFTDWIHNEITLTGSDRSALERKWADSIVQWKAERPKGERDFPWPGAPAFEFPLTAIHSDPVVSDFYQTLHTPDDYWTAVAKRPDRSADANPIREFLTALNTNYLRIQEVNGRALMDQVILGTAIYKNHWVHGRKAVYAVDRVKDEIYKQVKIHSAPKIEHVPLQHFLIPANAWNIDPDAPVGAAQWVAQKFYLTQGQLKQRAKSDGRWLPDYDSTKTELVLKFLTTPNEKVDETVRLLDQYTPFDNQRIELYEVHARFDVDNDGAEEDIIAVYHKDSRSILRVVYSPFLHGKRPFHATTYLPTFSFYGMGMAEKDEWAQYALSMLLEANVHNVLLSNTRAYAAPFGSTLRPGEPMYPGRVINLQNGESVGEIRLADIYQSLPQLQQWIMGIAAQATGVNELQRGDLSSLPGRTPATTVMSALAEGKKRFDMILSRTRLVHADMGLRLLQNVSQFYNDDPDKWGTFCRNALGDEDATKVIEVISQNPQDIEEGFGIQVSATSALVNKEAEKQGFVGMMQLVIPMYQQAVQTAQMAEQMPPDSAAKITAGASYSAIVELITRLLERFDIQNPREYLGQMDQVAAQMNGTAEQSPPGMEAMQQGMDQAAQAYSGQPPFAPYGAGLPLDPQTLGLGL